MLTKLIPVANNCAIRRLRRSRGEAIPLAIEIGLAGQIFLGGALLRSNRCCGRIPRIGFALVPASHPIEKPARLRRISIRRSLPSVELRKINVSERPARRADRPWGRRRFESLLWRLRCGRLARGLLVWLLFTFGLKHDPAGIAVTVCRLLGMCRFLIPGRGRGAESSLIRGGRRKPPVKALPVRRGREGPRRRDMSPRLDPGRNHGHADAVLQRRLESRSDDDVHIGIFIGVDFAPDSARPPPPLRRGSCQSCR